VANTTVLEAGQVGVAPVGGKTEAISAAAVVSASMPEVRDSKMTA
jgi:hypothetical protein